MWFSIVYGSRKSYCIFRLCRRSPPLKSAVGTMVSWCKSVCNLPLPLILDDMSPAQPFLRSNGSGTNPTMKGAATPVSARQEGAPF